MCRKLMFVAAVMVMSLVATPAQAGLKDKIGELLGCLRGRLREFFACGSV